MSVFIFQSAEAPFSVRLSQIGLIHKLDHDNFSFILQGHSLVVWADGDLSTFAAEYAKFRQEWNDWNSRNPDRS